MLALLRYLKGYVVVNIKGFFVEKFLNLCIEKNIIIWDVIYHNDASVTLKMSINAFKKIKDASKKTKTNVKIIKKCGIKFIINENKKRKGLVLGFILAFFTFVFLTSFIWTIEIEGNEKIKNEEILSVLKEAGFEKGCLRYNIDENELKNKILLKDERLSWIWVEIKGTKAFVSVREKKEKPKMFNDDTPNNIVAKRNGLVTQVVAKEGTKIAKEGDIVSKGDLLISGISDIGENGYSYKNATGYVLARTWHEKTSTISLKEVTFQKSFEKISKKSVNLFGFDVLLYIDKKIPYKHFEKEETVKKIPLIPISYKNTVFYELLKEEKTITKEEALKKESDRLKEEIEKELTDDIKIVKKDVDFNEETGKIKVTYECIEDIAEKKKIDT
ncbi:MAG: sporulation protein YqfD [Ruminococcaceae bacterium]|nr:sporulation protein YqfD [Oscillospiraceae bacterium]